MRNFKEVHIKPTLGLPDHTEILTLSRDTAFRVVQELIQEMSNTPVPEGFDATNGGGKLILRTHDNRFFIFKVQDT